MYFTVDLEHRRDVLAAIVKLEEAGERGGPAIRKLLAWIETKMHGEHQRLPGTQADMARDAGLTATQCSQAVKFLAEQRVLACRSHTKGRQSPTWEVYAGYASRLPEKRILAEMDRQNSIDFGVGGAEVVNLQEKLDAIGKRHAAEAPSIIHDERQPPLV